MISIIEWKVNNLLPSNNNFVVVSIQDLANDPQETDKGDSIWCTPNYKVPWSDQMFYFAFIGHVKGLSVHLISLFAFFSV